MAKQIKLSEPQIEAFHHSEFVEQQIDSFIRCTSGIATDINSLIDVGGGAGHFASSLSKITGMNVTVLDCDEKSIEYALANGIPALCCDALAPPADLNADIVSFNLILHHMVAKNELESQQLQISLLQTYLDRAKFVFVNEYIYSAFGFDLPGRLIYYLTKSKMFTFVLRFIGQFMSSLRANTLGVGVRFRSESSWLSIFEQAGYSVQAISLGENEPISLPRRLLGITCIRRQSFLLRNTSIK